MLESLLVQCNRDVSVSIGAVWTMLKCVLLAQVGAVLPRLVQCVLLAQLGAVLPRLGQCVTGPV